MPLLLQSFPALLAAQQVRNYFYGKHAIRAGGSLSAVQNNPWLPFRPNHIDYRTGLRPHSRTASLAMDHRFHSRLLLHSAYLHSAQTANLIVESGTATTTLSPTGRAQTKEVELTARVNWYAGQSWVVS